MEKEYYVVQRWWSNNWGRNVVELVGYFHATEEEIKNLVEILSNSLENKQKKYSGYTYKKISDISKEL